MTSQGRYLFRKTRSASSVAVASSALVSALLVGASAASADVSIKDESVASSIESEEVNFSEVCDSPTFLGRCFKRVLSSRHGLNWPFTS
ncbi:MAG: hypothetical protein Q8S08_11555 [Halomonas sp.]|nr:hypothetical protein [Halomonas sp.]MDP3536015.1 hypothetical protein [Halomonas sp.]